MHPEETAATPDSGPDPFPRCARRHTDDQRRCYRRPGHDGPCLILPKTGPTGIPAASLRRVLTARSDVDPGVLDDVILREALGRG